MIRDVGRGGDAVELFGREVLLGPRPAAGGRHGAAAVVADHEMLRVVRVDPEVVEVAVRAVAHRGHGLAGVVRAEGARVQHVHHVGIFAVGNDVRVIERALAHVPVVGHQRPRRARVVRLEQAALGVLHERVHAIRVHRRHRDADAAHEARGHAGVPCDLRPRLATVGALEQPAAGAARRHREFGAVRLPQRGVHHVGVGAVHGDVDGRRGIVAEQHAPKALAAVGALVHAALRVRRRVLAEGRDEDDVGVGRVDADLRDVLGPLEAEVRPRLAAVGRLVHAVACHDVAANARLTHADDDDVGVALRHRDGAHRGRVHLAVGDGRPCVAAIGRFPEPAADGAEVRLLRAPLHAADGDGPAAAIGPDGAPFVRLEKRGIGARSHGRLARQERALPQGGAGERDERGEQARKGHRPTNSKHAWILWWGQRWRGRRFNNVPRRDNVAPRAGRRQPGAAPGAPWCSFSLFRIGAPHGTIDGVPRVPFMGDCTCNSTSLP